MTKQDSLGEEESGQLIPLKTVYNKSKSARNAYIFQWKSTLEPHQHLYRNRHTATMHWGDRPLEESKITLHSYSGESIPVIGVLVKYSGQEAVLPLLVVEGDGSSLLSHNWLAQVEDFLGSQCYSA